MDKDATLQLAAKLEREAAMLAGGLVDRFAEPQRLPYSAHRYAELRITEAGSPGSRDPVTMRTARLRAEIRSATRGKSV